MAAYSVFAYLPPEKRQPFCTYFAAKSAQKKNPLAEVEPFYHIREDLSSVFTIFFKNIPEIVKKQRFPQPAAQKCCQTILAALFFLQTAMHSGKQRNYCSDQYENRNGKAIKRKNG